ncbi:MAG TPA: sensor domain-containing diguanylate cyclase, partial [Desulfuromonadaceae bacterium]
PIRRSITFRMTMAVCVFVVLFQSLLAVLGLLYFKREFKQTITDQQFTMLTVISQNIDQKLRSSQKIIVDVSRHVTPDIIRDSDAAQRFLDTRPGTKSTFDNGLFLFSSEGRIIAESPFLPDRRGKDVAFRNYFKRTMDTGKPVISEPYVSTHTPGAPAVMFTAPVKDADGRITAILAGSMNLLHDNFLGELAGTRIAKSGYLYLFASDRTMIMHPDKSRIMAIDVPQGVNKLWDRALSGFEGSTENVNSRGLRALTSVRHLHAVDWFIAANYPLDEAYAPIHRAQRYFALALIIGTVVIVIVVRRIMERNTRTLVRFASHVRDMTAKQGEERLFRHDADDEIGVLARTFNDMVRDEDRKSRELFHTSTHDALTGLFNRAYFDNEMARLARGRQTPVSVVIADIDGLKACNDSHGHVAGDTLITATAQALTESFRAEDVLARIGGDEFAVLLPGVGADQVEQTLERLRLAVHRMDPPVTGFPLSVSFGSATTTTPDELPEAFKQADQLMYREKRGKQTIVHRP